jgi:hypothetical protein
MENSNVMPNWIGKVADAIQLLGIDTLAAVVALICLWLPNKTLAARRLLKFRQAQESWISPRCVETRRLKPCHVQRRNRQPRSIPMASGTDQ